MILRFASISDVVCLPFAFCIMKYSIPCDTVKDMLVCA